MFCSINIRPAPLPSQRSRKQPLLTNEESALTVRQNRFLAAVALIQALGGGWDSEVLPSSLELETTNPLIPFIPPL